MTIWHRSGWNGTTPRCRSLNIANSTFSEGPLQAIPRICRFADRASHPPCKKHCKYHVFMQNAAKRRFWDHSMGGGGGGGSEPRTGIIYDVYLYFFGKKTESFRNAKEHHQHLPWVLSICRKNLRDLGSICGLSSKVHRKNGGETLRMGTFNHQPLIHST